jgi:RimJ/RimL family protein N-acetyltransferase
MRPDPANRHPCSRRPLRHLSFHGKRSFFHRACLYAGAFFDRHGCVLEAGSLQLVRGTERDIHFIMTTERLDGYQALVGRWDEAQHRVALADGRHAYFIARLGSQDVGFAIVRDWASPERVACIKRVAVSNPGQGHGQMFLAGLVDRIFLETDAYRIWLGVFPENDRARRAYEAAGFKAEGLARGSAFFGGVYRDELVMALVRPEWSTSRN